MVWIVWARQEVNIDFGFFCCRNAKSHFNIRKQKADVALREIPPTHRHRENDKKPLRPDDEIVQAHRRDFFVEPRRRIAPHGFQLLVLPFPLVDLADELDPPHK